MNSWVQYAVTDPFEDKCEIKLLLNSATED